MIPLICKALCMLLPGKQRRREARNVLTKMLTDHAVDNGKVYYLTSPCRQEYAKPDTLIKPGMKILCVAPHPDDETIGVGGILAKYSSQCDILCVGSSGYQRPTDTKSPEEIADERIAEFHAACDSLGVKNRWIVRIFGPLPHIAHMEKQMDTYRKIVNWKSYDLILLPDPFDGHREHQFVSTHLIPRLLREEGYAPNGIIGYYPVWGTVTCPNYFERTAATQDKKLAALACYHSRMQSQDNMGERVTALNYFYGFLADYHTKYAEALRIEKMKDVLICEDRRDWARYN